MLCGGGFAIQPAHHLIKEQMLKQGIPKEHLIETSDPGMIALSELKKLYVTQLNTEPHEEQTNAQQEQAA